MQILRILAAAALTAACATEKTEIHTDSAAGQGAPATMASADPDVAASGGAGVPAGYVGRTDGSTAKLSDAKYTASGERWEVQTGPAHIVYAPGDTARGAYELQARFEQLTAPAHPEAFGVILGGRDLDQPTQRYTYFLVRGTGEFLVKVREGTTTRDVVAWRANAAAPKADASGRAAYAMRVRVGTDSVRFLVNDTQVAAVAAGSVPTDGVAGLRINHNLHVATGPVRITR